MVFEGEGCMVNNERFCRFVVGRERLEGTVRLSSTAQCLVKKL